jgi:hypothetical protein
MDLIGRRKKFLAAIELVKDEANSGRPVTLIVKINVSEVGEINESNDRYTIRDSA